MNLIILAAGRGSRLSPITDTTPKPLLIINGKPVIEHMLDTSGHFENIYVVTGHHGDKLLYLESKYNNVKCITNKDWESTNTQESINVAMKVMKDDSYIANADNLLDLKYIHNDMPATTLFYTRERNSYEWTIRKKHGNIFSKNGQGTKKLVEIYFVKYEDFKNIKIKYDNFLMNLENSSEKIRIDFKKVNKNITMGDLDSFFDFKKFEHNYDLPIEKPETKAFLVRITGLDSKKFIVKREDTSSSVIDFCGKEYIFINKKNIKDFKKYNRKDIYEIFKQIKKL